MSQLLTGKPQLNRVVNRRLILDRIRRDGRVSRARIAKVTAIRPPTVSAVVKELISEGLVEEVGSGQTNGGRAPRMVALSRNQPRALGFEMSETSILAGVCDLVGSPCRQVRVPYSPVEPQQAIEQLYEIGSGLLESAGTNWDAMQGVGVALPGHLDTAAGHVRWSRPFGWRDVALKEMCEQRWGVATDVVNDSLAGGMAAHFFGVAKTVRNLVFLYLRFRDASHGVVGLGSGIIVNGEPYHGEFGAAGEITTPIEHPLADARDAAGNPYADMDALVGAFIRDEPGAARAVDRLARDLSTLVLHAVNFLEPGMLIIGSDISELRDPVLDRLTRIVQSHTVDYVPGKTQIVGSTLGEYGVVRGAVVPTLQRVFRMPRWS